MAKLLVVDDEPAIRDSLSIILEERGYQVDTAPNAQEGEGLMNEHRYDLILTDLVMPEHDGFHFIQRIRLKHGKRIPIIIITAHGTVEIASRAINEAVDDFIIKPFEVKTVLDAVTYALQKNKKEQGEGKNIPASFSHHSSFEKKFFGLSGFDELGKENSGESEIDNISDHLFEQIRQALQPDRGIMVLYNRHTSTYRYQRLCNADKLMVGQPNQREHALLERLKNKSDGLFLKALTNELSLSLLDDELETGALVAIPLIRHQRLLGAVILSRHASHPFERHDQHYLSLMGNMAAVALENMDVYDEMKNYFTGTIRALITTVETKDAFTFGHSARVAKYSLMIAEELNMNEMDKRRLEYLALLHDIGKIGIPETILKKSIPLTDEEWMILRSHPELGEKIVRSIHFLPEGASVVRHHHEFYDGGGYPDGLQGDSIPLFARIISVADAYDAMNSDRPYRNSMGAEKAAAELVRCKGTQFDPEMVALFIKTLNQPKRQVLTA
jgi:putative nucleotidyltransferase with HDIG domain